MTDLPQLGLQQFGSGLTWRFSKPCKCFVFVHSTKGQGLCALIWNGPIKCQRSINDNGNVIFLKYVSISVWHFSFIACPHSDADYVCWKAWSWLFAFFAFTTFITAPNLYPLTQHPQRLPIYKSRLKSNTDKNNTFGAER